MEALEPPSLQPPLAGPAESEHPAEEHLAPAAAAPTPEIASDMPRLRKIQTLRIVYGGEPPK
jgi:hypothetical protein